MWQAESMITKLKYQGKKKKKTKVKVPFEFHVARLIWKRIMYENREFMKYLHDNKVLRNRILEKTTQVTPALIELLLEKIKDFKDTVVTTLFTSNVFTKYFFEWVWIKIPPTQAELDISEEDVLNVVGDIDEYIIRIWNSCTGHNSSLRKPLINIIDRKLLRLRAEKDFEEISQSFDVSYDLIREESSKTISKKKKQISIHETMAPKTQEVATPDLKEEDELDDITRALRWTYLQEQYELEREEERKLKVYHARYMKLMQSSHQFESGSSSGLNDMDDDECIICMENTKTHRFVPCQHLLCCHECANRILTDARHGNCPYCRRNVSFIESVV